MELVLGTHHLLSFGGGESYLVTVAQQLQRLGHEVTMYAIEQGEMAEAIRERGLRVAEEEEELPESCDATLVQAASVAYALAARYPSTPQVFVCHSEVFSIDTPPQFPGVASAVVALSDRVGRHLRALSREQQIVRLRQPVDVWRFTPFRPIRPQPRRIAVISNYLEASRRDLLLEACDELRLECDVFGRDSEMTGEPELVMNRADIVAGKGRVVLEAMACGRAAYVYDWTGSDGWVTEESYPTLEEDAFAGQSDGSPVDRGRVVGDFARYSPDMGIANRDLAVANHSAERHAEQLVELLRDLAPRRRENTEALRELARLSREQWRAETKANGLQREVARERERADALERQVKTAFDALSDFKRTRRYRAAQVLARPLDILRGSRD